MAVQKGLEMSASFSPFALLEKIHAASPLVHHITNVVTIYDCAQLAKSFGASPVMANAPEEVADMASLASALVLNIGTLHAAQVSAMLLAAKAANAKGIPVVLDVCGAGATSYRDQVVADLLSAVRVDIIKGNASEIARVAGAAVQTKGVDAGTVAGDVVALARLLAAERSATVVVTGPVDIVTDGARTFRVANGTPLMADVVGTGCMAATAIGCFSAVEADPVIAAVSALVAYEIAAEIAAGMAKTPMAFKAALLDAVYDLEDAAFAAVQVEAD